ncbi:MAG: hypothetical protein JKY37_11185 [Nannocystaceae bacterium]|nr:hypothetical protein [Nannocystaceae bacterium]
MLRWSFVLLVAARQCGPQGSPGAPDMAEVPEPAADLPEAAEATEPPAAVDSTHDPVAVHTELGWVHDVDDPAAPIIHLTVADGFGQGGDVGVDAIVGAAGDILSCWEVALQEEERVVSVAIRLRAPSDPATDALTVAADMSEGELVRCVDDVLRDVVPTPQKSAVSWVTFAMLPRRDHVRLRKAQDELVVAVRASGSCWQWEDRGPCPPNKRCFADSWVRTDCGLPAMRDDVVARFGLDAPADGRAALTDTRLVGGDGIVWTSPLPSEFIAHYGRNYDSAIGPSVQVAPAAFAVQFTPATLLIADHAGVQLLDRSSGARTLSWAAPPRGERVLWFDSGHYSIRYGTQRCEGDAHNGAFFVDCGSRMIFFDGYTAAVFAGEPLALLGVRHLGQRGTTLSGTAVAPRASLRAGRTDIVIDGRVFMD